MAWIIWLSCIGWAVCLVLINYYIMELKTTIKTQNEEIAILRAENVELNDKFELL